MSDHEQTQIAAAAAEVVEFALTGAKTYSTLRDNFKEGEIYTTDQNGWDNYFSTATHPTRPDVLLFSLADDDFKAAKLEAINPPAKEDRVTSRSGRDRADANGEIDTGHDLSGADLELGGKKGVISIITNGKAEEFKPTEPAKESIVGDSGVSDNLGPGAGAGGDEGDDLGGDQTGQEGGEGGSEGPGTDTAQDPAPDAPAAPAKAPAGPKVVTPAKGKTLTPGKGGKGGKSVTV